MPVALFVSVADEVWIATALLHREQPAREDFTLSEIVERASREAIHPENRPGVRAHASRHCVANVAPSPATHRMLLETGPSRRRLFRRGDPFHPGRSKGKTHPDRRQLAPSYQSLLDWYLTEWVPIADDSLLGLEGTWKPLLKDKKADDYVRELREGWE